MRETRPLCLAIDTASDVAGVALSEDGVLLGEATWRTRQSHSRQLLPAIDWLLGLVERRKEHIGAIFVCTGPGSYAGMRVGLSTAKTLSYALGTSLVGVGRLAAEALPLAEATGARVIPVQAAGRAELAWAAYRSDAGSLIEEEAPQLSPASEWPRVLKPADIVTGDIDRLDANTIAALDVIGCRAVAAEVTRVVSIARLGYLRLLTGESDEADSLVPLYLRAPAIGPQPPPKD